MRARLTLLMDDLRNSYWFVPGLMTLAGGILAYLIVWADGLLPGGSFPGAVDWLFFDGDADGAAEILGTIATSMITVAGVIFSITIVVLTLASGQFGPRLLETFMRDRGTQVTLGTFVGGFTYALLVLRALQVSSDDTTHRLSVTFALLWALAGVGVLIYYIHHISIAIQAPVLIDEIASELVASVDKLFPDHDSLEHGHRPPVDTCLPAGLGAAIEARTEGYIELVDLDGLVAAASREDLVIALDTRPGRFVVPATIVARGWPADRVDDDLSIQLSGVLVTGPRRSQVQDVEFPILQLAEIAVRALSPAVNDPFTAITCVDQLSVGLCLLAAREFPAEAVVDDESVVRVVISESLTFEGLVDAAYSQIRQNAAQHSAVHTAMVEALMRIATCVHDPARLEPLEDQADRVLDAARREVPDERDLVALDQAVTRLHAACRLSRDSGTRERDPLALPD